MPATRIPDTGAFRMNSTDIMQGNAMPTKRQKKRSVSARMDPLAITNQLPHIAPAAAPGGELAAAGDVGDKETDSVAAKPAWPVAAPFGMTRSPDEA